MSQTPDQAPRDDELDPDADPENLPSPVDTSGAPPVDVRDTATVQDDPEDRDDPDGDPEMMSPRG